MRIHSYSVNDGDKMHVHATILDDAGSHEQPCSICFWGHKNPMLTEQAVISMLHAFAFTDIPVNRTFVRKVLESVLELNPKKEPFFDEMTGFWIGKPKPVSVRKVPEFRKCLDKKCKWNHPPRPHCHPVRDVS